MSVQQALVIIRLEFKTSSLKTNMLGPATVTVNWLSNSDNG